jgi:hypothetical protein
MPLTFSLPFLHRTPGASRPGSAPIRLALALLMGTALTLALVPGAQAQTSNAAPATACPPPIQMPAPEQMQTLAAQAADHGFLWRVSKGERRAWLYGTIHVGKLGWIFLGPQLRAALAAADTVALELDISDPVVAQQAAELSRAPANAPALPDALRQRLARQVALACLPAQVLDSQHPVMQAMTLTVLAGRWDGLETAFAQEMVLSSAAKSQAKPVVSLESVALQMGALLPSDPAKVVELTDHTLAQVEQGKARSQLSRLAGIWERSELDELSQYERWCDCVASDDDRAQMKLLNDDRNPQMANGIEALLAQGKRVFVAVGALHMIGEQGLPKLLQQRGYTVERVAFTPR